MKKIIILALLFATIFLASALAQDCTLPFKNCVVSQNFSNVVAGSTTESKITFTFKGLSWSPLIVRVNITSDGYEFSENDFSLSGLLVTQSIQQPSITYEFPLKCELANKIINISEYQFYPETGKQVYYCYNETLNILMPLSNNVLTLYLTPNIALIPSTFTITAELLSEVGLVVIDPNVEITNGKGELYIGMHDDVEKLEFLLSGNQNSTIKVTVYSSVFIQTVPKERPFGVAYFDFENLTSFSGNIEIRYYFNPMRLISKGYDITDLRFYKYEDYIWKLVPNSGVVIFNDTYAYAYAILPSLSIYGIFTSFQKNVQTISTTYYLPSQTIERTVNLTQVINQTQVIERPIERIIEIRPNVTLPVCGNNICEVGETWQNCPADCPEPQLPQIPTGYAVLAEPGVFGAIILISLSAGILGAIGFSYLAKKLKK